MWTGSAADAEVLIMLFEFLRRLGYSDLSVTLNCVPAGAARESFASALREHVRPSAASLGEDDRRRIEENPLRLFDSKDPATRSALEGAPRTLDFLDAKAADHYSSLKTLIADAGIPFTESAAIVRGLDYYTVTVFEVVSGGLGAQNAILGGGRYDGLSEALGGPRAPGIGFAIGEDRFVMALAAGEEKASFNPAPEAYIAPLGEGMNTPAARLASELRRAAVRVELGDESFRLKKSFETAEKLGIRRVVIVGENEAASNQFAVRDLLSGEQETVERK